VEGSAFSKLFSSLDKFCIFQDLCSPPHSSFRRVVPGMARKLAGCKSLRQVFAEPKARRRARTTSRGVVWRKPNPKMRGDRAISAGQAPRNRI
jgi:hypothetical protein